MPYGKGTYGKNVGRPSKELKKKLKKKIENLKKTLKKKIYTSSFLMNDSTTGQKKMHFLEKKN